MENKELRRFGRIVLQVDRAIGNLKSRGIELAMDRTNLGSVGMVGITDRNLEIGILAYDVLFQAQPMTLRGLFYRIVSAGLLPATDKVYYTRLGRLMTTLRKRKVIPCHWIVDQLRADMKPSSWADAMDYGHTCQTSYRLDYWSRLPEYVHVFVEKDAMSGVLYPVTSEYDITLSPTRGYTSIGFVDSIAQQWKRIRKPIHAYYLGDFDPSGMGIEDDLRGKLAEHSGKEFTWTRLSVTPDDFERYNLRELKVKEGVAEKDGVKGKNGDPRAAEFRRRYFDGGKGRCAELDAVPAEALRARLRQAIESHIPHGEWEQLQMIESAERASLEEVFKNLPSLLGGSARN
jgi:hypothetical protein